MSKAAQHDFSAHCYICTTCGRCAVQRRILLLGTVDCIDHSGNVGKSTSTKIGTDIVVQTHIYCKIAALVTESHISTAQIGPSHNHRIISVLIACDQICTTQIGTDCIVCADILDNVAKDILSTQISTDHIYWLTHISAHVDIGNTITQIGTNCILRTHIYSNVAIVVAPTQIGPHLSTICRNMIICLPLQSLRQHLTLPSCLCNLCISSALRCLLLIQLLQLLLHLLEVSADLLLLLL